MTSIFVIVLTLILSACAENCISTYDIAILKGVDSTVPEHVTVNGVIRHEEDAFMLTIANQSVPKLCENLVTIRNELTVLFITNVSLVDIEPGAFNITPTLGVLKISHNSFTTLKRGIFNSIKVKELDLRHNFISNIYDDTFENMTSLEIVKLSYNAIKTISPNWFQGSPNVYKLSIIFNELTSIPAGIFKNMAKNRGLRLRLSANQISDIHPGAFASAGDIDTLWMNGNKIRDIPDSLFANRTIGRLEVNTNNLQCFPEMLYQGRVRSLAFSENPNFSCRCLQKVRSFVDENHVDVWYPAIICEDRKREVNIVFNFNKTYELPILPSSGERT